MQSLRNKLLFSFFAVIASLLALSIFFVVMHFVLIRQYQSITDNMIAEYQLTDASTGLVNSFVILAKSTDDRNAQAQYKKFHDTITASFARLDVAITNQDSRVAYLGLKNTVTTLMNQLDAGIATVKQGDISGVSVTYDAALHESYFVAQDTGTLILDDLRYTQQVQANMANDELLSEIIGIFLFVLVGLGAALYAILFSRRIVAPLGNLTKLAKAVADGDLVLTVDQELLGEKDEVGSLANSFNVMVKSLRGTIYALDTEKKGVEEKVRQRTQELQEEQARLLASINSLPLGFLLVDIAGNVVLSNLMSRKLFPENATSLVTIGPLFTPILDVATFTRCAQEGQSYELNEVKFNERFFHIIATPVILTRSDGRNETIGVVLLLEDITQEKLLDQSKDAFLAIAAHEMRTPLTIIRGNAELMLEDPPAKENSGLRSQIESILAGSVRLLGIVNDFLDVQNLESGRVALDLESVDIKKLLTATIADLSVLAEKRRLTLVFDVAAAPTIPPLRVDKFRLQQIFINLIGNAINYTKVGGITVSIGKGDGVVQVFFQDTGIGIGPEEQARLFKKFATGQGFVHSKEYGSGLGLYISRFLAHLMGGNLVLEKSALGAGSTFLLTLPLE